MMVPTHFGSMARTRLLSLPAKARMGLDFLLPPRQDSQDESLGAFVSRRLGRPAYENLIEPLMSGIYAGDGDQLSLQATFPYLKDMESGHGGLIRGALALRQKMSNNGNQRNGSRSAFLTPTTGLAEIVEALVGRLQAGGARLMSQAGAKCVQKTTDITPSSSGRGTPCNGIIWRRRLPAPGCSRLAPELAENWKASLM
jgi:oxygen-dependent protoporphyrinogen oxidase